MLRSRPSLIFALFLLLPGCGGNGVGSLGVFVEAEDTIQNGLEPGEGVENVTDGWTVDFDKYVAVLGDIELRFATDEELTADAHEMIAIDLTRIPAQGVQLWSIEALDEGRWEFGYTLGTGQHDAERHDSVSTEDFERIVDEDLSYFIAGGLTHPEGVSCPPPALADVGDRAADAKSDAGVDCYSNDAIAFEFAVSVETSMGPCEIDGKTGVAITANKKETAAVTIHGDHVFFNGFPEGEETSVTRRAQWLADCDLNVDGRVTREELEAIAPADLAAMNGVNLGGALLRLDSMWDYVAAQLKTQGHFNGEGECPVDGVAHDHDH